MFVACFVLALDGFFQSIQFCRSVVLQRIAKPRGDVALCVGPRNWPVDVVFADGLMDIRDLRWRQECVLSRIHVEDFFRHRVEEFEDSCFGPLMFAERFVIHKQVAEKSVAVDLIHPLGKFFRRERPICPVAI